MVEQIMQDIQQMSEVGWLYRQEEQEEYNYDDSQTSTQEGYKLKPWQQEHLIKQSLVDTLIV